MSLASAFIAAPVAKAQSVAPASAPVPAASSSIEGLWLWKETNKKTKRVDVNLVLEAKKCADSDKSCMTIYWISPESTKSFDGFGDPSQTRKKITDHEDMSQVTEEDVLGLCGFSPKLEGRFITDTRWEGKMEVRGRGLKLDTSVQKISDDTLAVHSWKSIPVLGRVFNRNLKWTRIDPNDPLHPPCKKPGNPAP